MCICVYLCICMYVCMYVCMCVCIYIRSVCVTRVCISYTYASTHTHARTYTRTRAHTHLTRFAKPLDRSYTMRDTSVSTAS